MNTKVLRFPEHIFIQNTFEKAGLEMARLAEVTHMAQEIGFDLKTAKEIANVIDEIVDIIDQPPLLPSPQ
jgi:hypothetical protein